MRKLPLAAIAAVAVLAACGTDTKSCQTSTAPLAAVPSCTVAPGSTVSIQVRATQSCTESSPECSGELRGTDVELNPIFRVCQEDQGCANTGGQIAQFDCTFTAPAAGQYRLAYPSGSSTNPSLNFAQLNVAPGGQSRCTLSLAETPAPAP